MKELIKQRTKTGKRQDTSSQLFFRFGKDTIKTEDIKRNNNYPRGSNKNPAKNIHTCCLLFHAILTMIASPANNPINPSLVART